MLKIQISLHVYAFSLSGKDTLTGRQLSKLFCIPSEKGSTLKGKNLLPVEQILSF